MKIDILTLFPHIFSILFDYGVIGKAIDSKILDINVTNIRDFALDKHHKVDDEIYGGGCGMLMAPQPLHDAIQSVKKDSTHVIYLSPQGKTLTSNRLKELAGMDDIVLICGHYEGIDERIIQLDVDEEISIGDYVLSGGEIPALVLIDGISRWIHGVLGNKNSALEDSLENGLLKHPQFTRPRVYMGLEVPQILLSGHHKNICEWQEQKSIEVTKLKRPDLLQNYKKLKK